MPWDRTLPWISFRLEFQPEPLNWYATNIRIEEIKKRFIYSDTQELVRTEITYHLITLHPANDMGFQAEDVHSALPMPVQWRYEGEVFHGIMQAADFSGADREGVKFTVSRNLDAPVKEKEYDRSKLLSSWELLLEEEDQV